MTMRSGTADLHYWWQSRGGSLMLVALLMLVLVAALALAAGTPWVLDQPMEPYNWMLVP